MLAHGASLVLAMSHACYNPSLDLKAEGSGVDWEGYNMQHVGSGSGSDLAGLAPIGRVADHC